MSILNALKSEQDYYTNLRIVNFAYRRKPVVPQGGPAGVQALVEDGIGRIYRGIHIGYLYEQVGRKATPEVEHTIRTLDLTPMVAKCLRAADAVTTFLPKSFNPNFYNNQFVDNATYVAICHEIGTAYGAYCAGIPYTLVYHQQGASVYELKMAGDYLNAASIDLLNRIEKIAFENAKEVLFPSLGAQAAFFETTPTVERSNVNLAPEALYNTCSDLSVARDQASDFLAVQGLAELLDPEVRQARRVLISVGDYNVSKGMERSLEYAIRLNEKCAEDVVWIGIGRRNKSGVYEKIKERAEASGLTTLLIGDRLPHDLVMGLVDLSDQFVMMQRKSIFDFSTLEAMALGKSIVLAPVGGNLEFNPSDNIAFFDPDASARTQDKALESLAALDVKAHGARNAEVFEEYFSAEPFQTGYLRLMDRLIDSHLGLNTVKSGGLPQETQEKACELFGGRDVLILGPGRSALAVDASACEGKVVVALNSALRMDHVPFDVHFMQDEPAEAGSWSVYRNRDVARFYGRIQTPSSTKLMLDMDMVKKLCGSVHSYDLQATRFDARYQPQLPDYTTQPVLDMQSILFSAMQIIGWAGARSIQIAGIDFSARNHAGANPNKYSVKTIENLAFLVEKLRAKGVDVSVFATENADVQEAVTPESTLPEELEGLSEFRRLQWFCSQGAYKEGLAYFRANFDAEWLDTTKFTREAAQLAAGAGELATALYFYERYFVQGGTSKQCHAHYTELSKKLSMTRTSK